MNENLTLYKEKIGTFWKSRTMSQKGMMIGSVALLLLLFGLLAFFGTRSNFVPLYSNLTVQETGQIKETLDARGIQSQISHNGTTISVPEPMVDTLKVELAAEGIPNSGSIDYGTFKDGMGFGMTDNEFSVVERAAIQTELGNLIRNVDGVSSANVMITLPEESLWVTDTPNAASASIVVNTAPGYQIDAKQVRALYHLVSKSVPNLPIENIVIMNQMFEHLEYLDDSAVGSSLTAYEQQRSIKRDVEQDIQRQLQQMLGTIMGHDKVLVSVSTDIDFTQENRQEDLVTPVDEENMAGLAVSIERVTETYSGEDMGEGGIAGVGEGIPNYPGVIGGGVGDYERIEERINNDVNRIRRDIVESPYRIRDIGLQVMVEPPNPEDPLSLPQERINDIQQILGTIVRTSIDSNIADNLTDDEINQKIFVSAQPFNGKPVLEPVVQPMIPTWMYVVGGVLVAIIVLLVILLVRRKKAAQEETEEVEVQPTMAREIPDLPNDDDSEMAVKRKQLEKLAKDKPDDFAKLVRTWLTED
ncbi:flagellar basal-body MS-ring/collar protein FliF [Alkalihalobacillus sp. LMS39]|uniref:flagellar basal-body MS-ring/collar protein FliF n=1 Tax=Alkalihalobacillus sp. LMS39 TaxID=2924032 RepID=UPI001FB3B7BE|nr:flagellar basal-body MS-ring/collar protein FliF [Alkalihalobacillus sp. LMS39]UOE92842.1 flagellar M-ring protein FliF [Alkalihalobacillus sp. LMS39]